MPQRTISPSSALDALDNAQARLGTVEQMLANHDCDNDGHYATFGTDVTIAREAVEAIRLALHNATSELRATLGGGANG